MLDRLSSRQRDLLACLALIVVGWGVYAGSLHVPWYFDDRWNITENQAIRSLPGALSQFFTPRGPALVTFALNYALNGESLPGYHLVNISIHLLSSLLVYLIMKRLTGNSQGWALAGALLFLCHPLQTQAVTYIVQRIASLCGMFALLGLYSFIRGRELINRGGRFFSPQHLAWYAAMLAASGLAVLTKQNAAFLPLGLLLFDRLFLNRPPFSWRRQLLYLAPFFLVPALLALKLVLLPLLAGQSLDAITFTRSGSSPLRYFLTECSVLWVYLRLMVLPYNQTLDYGYPLVEQLLALPNMAAFAGLAGLALLAYRVRRSLPPVSFGIAWFFASLAVESSFIPLDPLFEHRLYLAMLGFAAILVCLLQKVPQRGVRIGGIVACLLQKVPQRGVRIGGIVALIALYALLTTRRNALWSDPVAFNEDNRRVAPNNPRVYLELSQLYIQKQRYNDALEQLNRAITLDPRYVKAYDNLGTLHDLMGNDSQAIAAYRAAIGIDPGYIKPYINLGVVYTDRGEYEIAEGLLRKAISLNGSDAGAHFNLGVVLYKQGRLEEAMTAFLTASRLAPFDADPLLNLAITHLDKQDFGAARALLPRLGSLNPRAAEELARDIALREAQASR